MWWADRSLGSRSATKENRQGKARRLPFFLSRLNILVGVGPCVHDIVKGHARLHFTVGELVLFLVALSDAFAVCVDEREAVGTFVCLYDSLFFNGRLRKLYVVNTCPIGCRGQQTNVNNSLHVDSS